MVKLGMTKNTFAGAVLVINDSTNPAELADYVAKTYFHTEYQFTVTESTPANLPLDLQEKTNKQKEARGGTGILTVYPTN